MVGEIILVPESQSAAEAAKAGAQYAARSLSAIGVKVRDQISVCQTAQELQKAVAAALGRSNVVVTVGGLTARSGYLTKTVVSRGLKLELKADAGCLAAIQAWCSRTGEAFSAEDAGLAQLPAGCKAFAPQAGKTPGFAVSSSKQHIICLPGSQGEIAPILSEYVIPYLAGGGAAAPASSNGAAGAAAAAQNRQTVTRTLRTYGISQEAVKEKLGELLDSPNPAVTLHQEGEEVLVRVSARDNGSPAAALCTPVLKKIVDLLEDYAYGLDVESLQAAVVSKLKKKDQDLAVAECGTGGVFTRTLSGTAGGTSVLRYSTLADGAQALQEKLELEEKVLAKGPVAETVAVHMANVARRKGAAKLGVGITANTGPGGDKKCPVGQVFIAVCDEQHVYVKRLTVDKGEEEVPQRDNIVDAAVSRALNMVRLFVDYLPKPYKVAIPLEEALAGKTVTHKASYNEDGGSEEDMSFGKRLLNNFIIRRSDPKEVIVKKAVFILCVLVFLGCGGYVGKYYYDSFAAKKLAEKLQNLYEYGDGAEIEIAEDFPDSYLPQFAALYTLNQDVVGYLSIDNTSVAYPIVQQEDNDYYLRRDYMQKSNDHGIPFMDYRVDITEPSDNMVIYGHNMKDGQIFGELMYYNVYEKGYDTSLEFYREHPIIDFDTVYEERQYKIISVFITNAYSAQGPVFAYHNFIEADSDDDMMAFAQEVMNRSLINTTVDVEPGDKLLTLSTCTYEFTEARFVVVARAVRDGESPDVDVDGATINPSPKMPDIWYSVYGGSNPYAGTNTSVVTQASTAGDGGGTASVVTSTTPAASAPASAAASAAPSSSSQSSSSSSRSSSSSSQSSSSSSRSSSSSSQSSSSSSQASSSSSSQASSSSSSQAASSSSQGPSSASEASSEPSSVSEASSEPSPPPEESSQPDDGGGGGGGGGDDGGGGGGGDDGGGGSPDGAGTENEELLPYRVRSLMSAASLFDAMDPRYDPRGSGGAGSSSGPATAASRTLQVTYAGTRMEADALDIVTRVVQREVGSGFHTEAIKAQAVAAYTYISFDNAAGKYPVVYLADEAADNVRQAVAEVLGEMVYYGDDIAFTPYHATSAGSTTSSQAVWGGAYPYLVPVDSAVDRNVATYQVMVSYSSSEVAALIESKLGITVSGSPSGWIEILDHTDGGYVGTVRVGGTTTNPRTNGTITGRTLRESVFGLRSACFTVSYDSGTDRFTFTTYGYGHGVGMSQNGANQYASAGWTYKEILTHYYPGTQVR